MPPSAMTTPPYLRRVSPAASCFGCAGGEAPTLDDNDVAPLLDVETGGGDRRGRPSAEEMRTGKQPRREPTTTDAEMMHEWNRAGVMAIKCVVRGVLTVFWLYMVDLVRRLFSTHILGALIAYVVAMFVSFTFGR
ncbi:hypothetical protein DAI22_02g305700 [Oryza sativa Japonica Group]|nr:uncharacterized protein LOC112937854 [Oryza sativa Japonica Group]KAF2946578.1 hypothetical protein DAI22_02g305700 [Oryza sativa Japonica Group]